VKGALLGSGGKSARAACRKPVNEACLPGQRWTKARTSWSTGRRLTCRGRLRAWPRLPSAIDTSAITTRRLKEPPSSRRCHSQRNGENRSGIHRAVKCERERARERYGLVTSFHLQSQSKEGFEAAFYGSRAAEMTCKHVRQREIPIQSRQEGCQKSH